MAKTIGDLRSVFIPCVAVLLVERRMQRCLFVTSFRPPTLLRKWSVALRQRNRGGAPLVKETVIREAERFRIVWTYSLLSEQSKCPPLSAVIIALSNVWANCPFVPRV